MTSSVSPIILEIRIARNPRMMANLFRFVGLPREPSRSQLERHAADRTVVMIQPRT